MDLAFSLAENYKDPSLAHALPEMPSAAMTVDIKYLTKIW